jgi:hypothetical protein
MLYGNRINNSWGAEGMKKTCVLLLVLLFIGCKYKQAAQDTTSPPPISIDSAVEFSVSQRTTTPLPKSDDKLLLTLDDITAGQVLVTLSCRDGKTVVATRSLRQNDIVTFTVSNHVYKLKLKKLTNVLIGEDTALFQLWPAAAEAESVLSEQDKIETLLSSLRQLSGAKFIRNGREHTVDEAVAHIKKKWEWKKTEIKTAQDFITIAGSKSSVSGEPYLMRLSDGTEMKLEEWFHKQLDLMKTLDNKPRMHISSDKP